MLYDVGIIGASASGLACAYAAAKNGKQVLLLEKNDRIGRKIAATGNGKCNVANTHFDDSCYRSTDKAIINHLMNENSYNEVLSFLEDLGVPCTEKNGYYYPSSMQATTVIRALEHGVKHYGVNIVCGMCVTDVHYDSSRFQINCGDNIYEVKNLVLATGGCASAKHGSDGFGFELAKKFGHSVMDAVPALVPLTSDAAFCKQLSGVRQNAKAVLKIDGKVFYEEQGEVQFTDYGISGIVIFNMSRFANLALKKDMSVDVELDLLPDIELKALLARLIYLSEKAKYASLYDIVSGFLPDKLANVVIGLSGLASEQIASKVNGDNMLKVAKVMKSLVFHISGNRGFEQAQVTAGGVSLAEISDCFASTKKENLYLVGEILDVDGACGGYNLSFAFLSGLKAGKHII